MTASFQKVVCLGATKDTGKNVFCKISFTGTKLSITGVIGPARNGDAESCGQIVMSLDPSNISPAEGWSSESIVYFLALWDRWNLNDMTAGSPAQERALRERRSDWEARRSHYRGSHYDWAVEVLSSLGLQPDNSHNDYRYGSAWLYEEIPEDVLNWLSSRPHTQITPAWV